MNIDLTLGAQINTVSIKVTAKEGVIRRVCKLVLAREFDVTLAAALGKDAKATLKQLQSGALSEATIPIDRIVCRGRLKAMEQTITIESLRGVHVKAKFQPDDEGGPTCKIELEHEWEERAWVFLGRHCSAYAELDLKSVQTELGFDELTLGTGEDLPPGETEHDTPGEAYLRELGRKPTAEEKRFARALDTPPTAEEIAEDERRAERRKQRALAGHPKPRRKR